MRTNDQQQDSKVVPTPFIRLRVTAAVSLVALVAAYTIGIISGHIAEGSRIDVTHFGLIVAAGLAASLLVCPRLLDGFKSLKVGGLEFQMQDVIKKQAEQQSLLEEVNLVLPLLFPMNERKHILNLQQNPAMKYTGGQALRDELRRLRSIGLIESIEREGRIADIKDGMSFRLDEFMRLTALGRAWVKRLEEIEAPIARGESG